MSTRCGERDFVLILGGERLVALPALLSGCVRSETMKMADRRRGRPETGLAVGQAAASSAMTAAQRSWKRHRRSASETRSADRARARK